MPAAGGPARARTAGRKGHTPARRRPPGSPARQGRCIASYGRRLGDARLCGAGLGRLRHRRGRGQAATLTGLLFVAVSINLQRILQYPNLPGRAAQTLVMFSVPLVFSIFVLVPGQPAGPYWLVPAALVAIVAGLANTWVLLIEILR